MHKVNWGILGTSFISEVMAQAIQSSENAQLVSVGSRTIENAKKLPENFLYLHAAALTLR